MEENKEPNMRLIVHEDPKPGTHFLQDAVNVIHKEMPNPPPILVLMARGKGRVEQGISAFKYVTPEQAGGIGEHLALQAAEYVDKLSQEQKEEEEGL